MGKSLGVLHVNSASASSTSPTMRIAKFVSSELNCPLVHDVASARLHVKTKFDVLFVKYGLLGYSEHRGEAMEIYNNARFIVNLENDVTFAPDKRFRKPDETWSTVEGQTRYVNWNMLTRHPLTSWKRPSAVPHPTKRGLVYYGAFKEGDVGRDGDFRKYFDEAPYPVTISTFSSRSKKKFAETCRGAEIISAFRNPDAPAQYDMTLYIEDVYSHQRYSSPANRFYECLLMGLPQAIDLAASNTLLRAGMVGVEKFVVNSKADIKRMMSRRDDMIIMQRALWFKDYGAELRAQFKKVVREALR